MRISFLLELFPSTSRPTQKHIQHIRYSKDTEQFHWQFQGNSPASNVIILPWGSVKDFNDFFHNIRLILNGKYDFLSFASLITTLNYTFTR